MVKKTKSVQIDKDIHQKIRVYCALKEKGMAEVIEKACIKFLKQNKIAGA